MPSVQGSPVERIKDFLGFLAHCWNRVVFLDALEETLTRARGVLLGLFLGISLCRVLGFQGYWWLGLVVGLVLLATNLFLGLVERRLKRGMQFIEMNFSLDEIRQKAYDQDRRDRQERD